MLCKTILTAIVILVQAWSVFAQRRVIPVCPKPTEAEKLVGFQIKLRVPKDTVVDQGSDIDYSYWSIVFSREMAGFKLLSFSGLNVGNGEPLRGQVAASRRVSRRYWAHGNERGVDTSGTFKNGKRWRNFGTFGEVIWYYNVPADVAAYFDRLLETVCFEK